MAKYMSFNFADCYEDNYPVIIRFEEDLTHNKLMQIANKFKESIADFRERKEDWDSDEALLDNVLKEFGYKYEYVDIDENVEID